MPKIARVLDRCSHHLIAACQKEAFIHLDLRSFNPTISQKIDVSKIEMEYMLTMVQKCLSCSWSFRQE